MWRRVITLMRAILWAVICASTALASADPRPPIAVTARAHGSAIDVKLHNTGAAAVAIPINSRGFDDRLSIRLTTMTGATRDLTFHEPQNKPTARTTTIAPGAAYTETIDLVAGALAANVDPPAPGDYRADVVWNNGVALSASTTLTIAAPVEKKCTGKATSGLVSGLELLGRQVTPDGTVEIGLHNTSPATICVAARMEARGPQSDWLSIELADGLGTSVGWIGFERDRKGVHRITVELAPGATTWARWELAVWAPRSGFSLPKKLMYATATYDSTDERDVFRAKLVTHFAVNVR